ncbi:MAG: archaeosortase/exosortase family protein [Bacteroidota bacterium]
MSKPKKKRTKSKSGKTVSSKPTFSERLKSGWQERKDFILFVVGVLGLLGGFFWLSAWSFYLDYIFTPVTHFYAMASTFILNLFGMGITVNGEMMVNPAFQMSIAKGCDGIAPIILLIAGVLMFPSKWKYKWRGIIYGTLALILLNQIRIVSLFLFGVYTPNLFDIMHVEVWQALFIATAILLWLTWLIWANNQELKVAESSAKIETNDTH